MLNEDENVTMNLECLNDFLFISVTMNIKRFLRIFSIS